MRFTSTFAASLASSTLLIRQVAAYAINTSGVAGLPLCSTVQTAPQYDYIVVGSGPGGGPLAARLALKGFKVLVIDAGHDVVNTNTTLPFYFARSNDDPQLALDYYANLYSSSSQVVDKTIQDWYPRGSALGGSAIHNALINVVQMKWDLDNIASITGDSSWTSDNVRPYFKKLENNRYIASTSPTGPSHGYSGWLSTDQTPTDLLAPPYFDQQFTDLFNSVQTAQPFLPGADINAVESENVIGGAIFPITTDAVHNRSSIRDFLSSTSKSTTKLQFKLDSLATKVLLCKSNTTTSASVTAYGVSYASGPALLPVARQFGGKKTLTLTNVTAKYEVIVATGVYQTPQLLQLSGLGPTAQLTKYKIPTVVDLAGVGENLQDRLELTVLYAMKQNHVIYNGCEFTDSVQSDPCLEAWSTDGHTNLYSSGAAVWGATGKSSPSVPYNDIWNMFIAGAFTGYFPGYGQQFKLHPNIFGSAILKGHAAARGWARITSNNPQDKLDINKNLYTNDLSIADRTAVREQVKAIRKLFSTTANISKHIDYEFFPGNATVTDAQIDTFIDVHGWGHHACCTAKIGVATDTTAVVNSAFQVFGVNNLRIVDNSVWPVIPGLFVTTPIYMMSEKAADVVIAYAGTKGWTPSP